MSIFKIQKQIEEDFKRDPKKFMEFIKIPAREWPPEDGFGSGTSYYCPFHQHQVSLNIDKLTGVWSCGDGCQGDIISLMHKLTERKM